MNDFQERILKIFIEKNKSDMLEFMKDKPTDVISIGYTQYFFNNLLEAGVILGTSDLDLNLVNEKIKKQLLAWWLENKEE